jgi:carboxymethylenebutenolidase
MCSMLLEASESGVFKEDSMREFLVDGRTISAYLAVPEQGSGPGVLVLHAWWGLTDVFKQVCDRLAEAGFVALAPDLYRGKTTTSVEEAQALGAALDRDVERVRGDIAGAVQVLRQHDATHLADSHGKRALVGFSLGGAYALDMSITLAEEKRPEYDAEAARLAWQRTIEFLHERLD